MKLRSLLLAMTFCFSTTVLFAQVEGENTPPEEVPVEATTETPAVSATPARPAPAHHRAAAPRTDTIKGNAGRVVELVDGNGSCASGLHSYAIVNKSPDKVVKARVDMLVVFHGRASKKSMLIDNLIPGETRLVGCGGCISNPTGKTCTTIKIYAAAYKQ